MQVKVVPLRRGDGKVSWSLCLLVLYCTRSWLHFCFDVFPYTTFCTFLPFNVIFWVLSRDGLAPRSLERTCRTFVLHSVLTFASHGLVPLYRLVFNRLAKCWLLY